MHERLYFEQITQDERQIVKELGMALKGLKGGMELLQGSNPKDYNVDNLRLRVSDILSKLFRGEDVDAKTILRQETTASGIISRISFNQLGASGTRDRVTITTFRDKDSRVPVYLEAEIAPTDNSDPDMIRRYQLARRDKL